MGISPEKGEAPIIPQEEQQWDTWNNTFGVMNQKEYFTLKYICEIYDEAYTTYFTMK